MSAKRSRSGDGSQRAEKIQRGRVVPGNRFVAPSLFETLPSELIFRLMSAMDGETFSLFRRTSTQINNLFLLENGRENMELVTRTLSSWLQQFLTDDELARGYVGRDVLRSGSIGVWNKSIHYSSVSDTDSDSDSDSDDENSCTRLMNKIILRDRFTGEGWVLQEERKNIKISRDCKERVLRYVRDVVVANRTYLVQHEDDIKTTLIQIIDDGVRDGFGVALDRRFAEVWSVLVKEEERHRLRDDVFAAKRSREESNSVRRAAVLLRETQNVPLLAIHRLIPADIGRILSTETMRLRYLIKKFNKTGVHSLRAEALLTPSGMIGLDWIIQTERTDNDLNRIIQHVNAVNAAVIYEDTYFPEIDFDEGDEGPRFSALDSDDSVGYRRGWTRFQTDLVFLQMKDVTVRRMIQDALSTLEDTILKTSFLQMLSNLQAWDSNKGVFAMFTRVYLLLMYYMRDASVTELTSVSDLFSVKLMHVANAIHTHVYQTAVFAAAATSTPLDQSVRDPKIEAAKLIVYVRDLYHLPTIK